MNRKQRRADAKAGNGANPVGELLNAALQHHQNGRLEEAASLYSQILEADPRHADANHLLGVIAFQLGRNELAVDLIGIAIAANRSNPAFHSNLGNALNGMGRPDDALAAYDTALRLQPDYAQAHNSRGNTLLTLERYEEALSCFDKALSVEARTREESTRLNCLYQLNTLATSSGVDRHAFFRAALTQSVLFSEEQKLLAGFIDSLASLGTNIRSQLLQDAFAAFIVGDAFEKTFLEFGATNGVELSNSFMLEAELGWTGVLAEPSPQWHAEIYKNRPSSTIITECIWNKSGQELDFFVSDIGVLSTLNDYLLSDMSSMPGNTAARTKAGRLVKVKTVSLNEVIAKYFEGRAPSFMSIDTEGSEYEILSALDFSEYRPVVLTVEHNFTDLQEKIDSLLGSNGFVRVFRHLTAFDAWYVRADVLGQLSD
jgi:FkbM family methyltransferase